MGPSNIPTASKSASGWPMCKMPSRNSSPTSPSACGNDTERLTAKLVAQAAADGNEIARQVLDHACQALGWAMAQVITLIAPEIVIVGGGVSLIGEQFFFMPLRAEVARYVFPPLAGSYRIVPAGLGELAVVHGAIALARGAGVPPAAKK